jgi:hypothetical protein
MPRRSVMCVLPLALLLGCLSGCGGNSEEGVKHIEQLPPGRVPQMKKNGPEPSAKQPGGAQKRK